MSDNLTSSGKQPGVQEAESKQKLNPVSHEKQSTDLKKFPITNETVPAEQRLKKLRKKAKGPNPSKRKIWATGHFLTFIFGSISILFQFIHCNAFYINSISYRLTLIGAIASLSTTTSRRFGLSFLPPIGSLLAYQNFQYIILALIWLVTFKSIFKIIPFYIVAFLHIGSHYDIKSILAYDKTLADVIAFDELILIVYLLLRTLFFKNSSGFQLLAFFIFYWLRILYNKETTTLFLTIIDKLDYYVKDIKNEKFQKYWGRGKYMMRERQKDGM